VSVAGPGAALPAWAALPVWALALALVAASLPGLRAGPAHAAGRHRVLAAVVVAVMALRWFNTAALQGVVLHFLGATVATRMLGARAALFAMALASLAGLLLGAAWQAHWALDFLLTGALPVVVTVAVGWASARWVPANIFTYIMVEGFVAAALAMAASMLARFALASALAGPEGALGGPATATLAATPLMMFGEAFLSGGLLAIVVVYRPAWCASFDDRTYLGPGRPL